MVERLGLRRTSGSVLANTLQQAGFVHHGGGHIRILDLERLQQTARECRQAVESQAARLTRK
jgi:hypothetical protein